MADPRPEEFRRFHELLTAEAPEGYRPWYFRCRSGSKAPQTTYGSWKDEGARLDVDKAVKWMEKGGNVGIAGTEHDALVNVDIDDEDETEPGDLKETLIARSRSRTGRHAWYFAAPDAEIPNIPTDNAGEVRTEWQYVVAPGSYVETDPDEVPADERDDAGYYTVERAAQVTSLRYDELPAVFRDQHEQTEQENTDADLQADLPDPEPRESDGGRSALFEITAEDVVRKEGGSTDTDDRWSALFHGSDTDANMSVSSQGLVQCWRHNVTHNGLQALTVLSDYSAGCERVGAPHKGSNAGTSCLQREDGAHIWHAWKYAKRNGYIPDDDPVPYNALRHLCRDRDLCAVTEIPAPGGDGTIPASAYNNALRTIREHDELEPGRKMTTDIVDEGDETAAADGEGAGTGSELEGTSDSEPPDVGPPTTVDISETAGPDAETADSQGSDDDTDDTTDSSEPVDWETVRKGYQTADDADERLGHRYQAVQVLDREMHWRNIEETDTLWSYDSDLGIFQENGKQRCREVLVRKLREQFRAHEQSEMIEQLKGRSTVPEDRMGGPDGKVAAANGVLDIGRDGEITIEDHNPEYEFLSVLGAAYDPDADCPRFEQFLTETVSDPSDRLKLQEYAGYCLMHWQLPYHKGLFLVGPTASGKSTFLDAIRGMLGDDATVNLTPQEMTSGTFGGAELYGSWANIRNDIPAQMIENTGSFKELVAGDPVKAEKKYEDPFMFEPNTKHLFSANQLPEASTDDEAFYRRILLVAFPETIPRPDRDARLDAKLEDELSGILNWALEGLQRLQDQAGFTGDRPPGVTQNTWEKWCNSVKRFVQVCVEDNQDEVLPKDEAYDAYLAFCNDEGIPHETRHKFTRDFKNYSGYEDGRTYVDAGGGNSRKRVFFDCQFTGRGDQYQTAYNSDADADAEPDSATGPGGSGINDY